MISLPTAFAFDYLEMNSSTPGGSMRDIGAALDYRMRPEKCMQEQGL